MKASKLMTFDEAKAYIQKNVKISGKTEKQYQKNYEAWWDANKEENERIGLPRNPQEVYAKINQTLCV